MKVYFSLHIWKEHVEIDQITNFHEKIIWQSLLYRIPLNIWCKMERVISHIWSIVIIWWMELYIQLINHFDRDHMVVWFTTTCAISAYHHSTWEFELSSGEVYLTKQYVWDKVYPWLAGGQWFSPGTPVSSTN